MTDWPADDQNLGGPRRPVTGHARDELRAYVVALCGEGMRVGAIAGRIGRSGYMVRRLLAEADVVMRPPMSNGAPTTPGLPGDSSAREEPPRRADRHLIDVHLLLLHDDQVLLTRRRDTDPLFDGRWHLPSGKLDAAESALHAAAREAHEEVGVHINPADLRLVHTAHVNNSGPEPRLGLFFAAHHWTGTPTNREPDKCTDIAWFPLTHLPSHLIDYSAAGIHAYTTGHPFSTHGWSRHPSRTPA